MNYWEAESAIKDAEETMKRADLMANSMVKILVGRLRKVNQWTSVEALCNLKRELRDFNISTKTWKS